MVLKVVLIVVCTALIGIILIQRGRGGGLAGAFGGGGVEQAFGTHAATLAQKTTIVLAVLFLVLSVVLGILYQKTGVTPTTPAPAEATSRSTLPPAEEAEW